MWAKKYLSNPALRVLAAFVLLILGEASLAEASKYRNPGGSDFPAGGPIFVVCCLAAVLLTVSAVRRQRSVVVVAVSILNGFVLALIVLGIWLELLSPLG